MRLRFWSLVPLVVALCGYAGILSAQTKIEPQLEVELRRLEKVRVIILTRPDPDEAAGGAALSSPASYLSGRLGSGAARVRPVGSFPAVTAEISREALETMREDPNVALVARDVLARPFLSESVPLIGAIPVHQRGLRGEGHAVAVLDTGIDRNHAALSDAIVAEACFSTAESIAHRVTSLCPDGTDMSAAAGSAGQCPSGIEGCEHGSHVAGIVAGRDMQFEGRRFGGVAPAAKVVAVQVFTLINDEQECGPSNPCIRSFTSDQLRALDWLYKKRDELKIAAVNMSLGTGYFDRACDASSPLTGLVERLRAKGIATVVAAGNDRYYDGVAEPACISSVITVAATRKDGSLDVSYSNSSPMVDFVAPGTNIVSSVPGGYRAIEGTSMAAPHVAAAFALMRERFPLASVVEIQSRLAKDAPTIFDQRNDANLVVLELTHAAISDSPQPEANAAAPTAMARPASARRPTVAVATGQAPRELAQGPEPVLRPTEAAPKGWTGSYVVQSTTAVQPDLIKDMESGLAANCKMYRCDLKQISDSALRLEIAPRSASGAPVPTAGEVESLLGQGARIRVYDNRLSKPKGGP